MSVRLQKKRTRQQANINLSQDSGACRKRFLQAEPASQLVSLRSSRRASVRGSACARDAHSCSSRAHIRSSASAHRISDLTQIKGRRWAELKAEMMKDNFRESDFFVSDFHCS